MHHAPAASDHGCDPATSNRERRRAGRETRGRRAAIVRQPRQGPERSRALGRGRRRLVGCALLALATAAMTLGAGPADAAAGPWQLVGGLQVTAGPAVISSPLDGRLYAFANSGSTVYYASRDASGAWTGWSSLGTLPVTDGTTADNQPAVLLNADGRMEVFVNDLGDVVHQWQLVGGGWSGWHSLGGNLDTAGSAAPVVASDAQGILHVFAVSSDQASIMTISQTSPNGGWGGWSSLGQLTLATWLLPYGGTAGDLAVGHNADGRLQLFVIGGGEVSGPVLSAWQLRGGGWSSWTSFGGGVVGGLTAANSAGGQLEVFGYTWESSDRLVVSYMSQIVPNGSWTSWSELSPQGGFDLGNPTWNMAAALNPNGQLELFAANTSLAPDGSVTEVIYHSTQDWPNSGEWTPWTTVAGPAGSAADTEVVTPITLVTSPASGQLELFGETADDSSGSGTVAYTDQISPITGVSSGLCVDVRGANRANFTPVQVYTCNGTAAQQWAEDGADFSVRALGKCLDIRGGGTANGTTVDLYDCNGTGAQVFIRQSDGSLVNPQSGKCLDDPNWSATPGTQLQIWDCTGSANQQWTVP